MKVIKTRILPLLLCLAMVLSMVLVPVSAVETNATPSSNDSTMNQVGYNQAKAQETRKDVSSLTQVKALSSAPTSGSYRISEAEDIIALATLVNATTNKSTVMSGVTFYLSNDIDMSTTTQTQAPIGYRKGTTSYTSAKFGGTLDGQGYTINNININLKKTLSVNTTHQYAAFFGWTEGATIKNLVLHGNVAHTSDNADYAREAGLIASGNATISNVYCDVNVSGPGQKGGFVGGNGTVSVTDSTNAGNIYSTEFCAGGFFGYAVDGSLENCLNVGHIDSPSEAGGIVARNLAATTLKNCVNRGAVTSSSKAGGIIGIVENNSTATLTACANYGMVIVVNSNTNFNELANVGAGSLNANETNLSQSTPGYDAFAIKKINLTSVDDITTLADDATPSASAYKITNAAGLVKLSTLVNAGKNFSGKTVYLNSDIDMSSVENFAPIGIRTINISDSYKTVTNHPFSGTFNGLGYTIKGLTITYSPAVESGESNNICVGLFGNTSGANIRNLILDDSCTIEQTTGNYAYGGTGGVVGYATGATYVINVCNKARVIACGNHAAGIVGRGSAYIRYCTNYGTVTAPGNAGGIAAFCPVDVDYCVNYGMITGGEASGGVVARFQNAATYTRLVNYGTVNGSLYVGGIVGRTTDKAGILDACFNYGYVASDVKGGSVRVDPFYTVQDGCVDNITVKDNCKNISSLGYSSELITPVILWMPNINRYDVIPDATAYQITDAKGLQKLATLVNGGNSLAGITIYLANDIDMSGATMLPIGYGSNAFSGILDGLGHSIQNLVMSYNAETVNQVALFGYASNATVKNLIIDASCSFTRTGTSDYGAVAAIIAQGNKACMVYNVYNKAAVSGGIHSAGIAGRDNLSAINCTNSGNISGLNSAGGILAYAASHVTNCDNYGNVTANKAGGIVGRQERLDTYYISSANYGTVTSNGYAGGLVGAVRVDCTIIDCANYGMAAPVAGSDCVVSSRYNVEKGYIPTVSGSGCMDYTSIGYSAERATAGKVDISALLETDTCKNIEDYVHDTDNGKVTHLIIDSAADMVVFSKLINKTTTRGAGKTFLLANDIDMKGYTFDGDPGMATAKTFSPIGWDKVKDDGELISTSVAVGGKAMSFDGVFDGQGYTIKNLKISSSSEENNYIGLFGYLNGATVKNLIIDKSCSFTSTVDGLNFKIGALAGGANNATISNVWNQAKVNGGVQTAGLIGRCSSTTFDGCTNSGNVTSTSTAGGFAGFSSGLRLYNCRNTGNITGDTYTAAGFVARDRSTSIYVNCINMGDCTAPKAGAIIAEKDQANAKSTYQNCYNYGAINRTMSNAFTTELIGWISDATTSFAELGKTNANNEVDAYHISKMLDTRFQISKGTDTFKLRLVSTVDSLNYSEVGVHFAYDGATEGKIDTIFTSTEVYTSIYGNEVTYTPDVFTSTSKYFVTFTITNIPNKYLADFENEKFVAESYLITQNGNQIGYAPIEEINIPQKMTVKITTPTGADTNGDGVIDTGVIARLDTPLKYPIGNTGVSVDLQYHAWPSVTVDENGTLYAMISRRLAHVDPYAHTTLYKSTDNGKTWSSAIVVTDTPMDDRDVGVTYLGGGRMIITYFRINALNYMKTTEFITTTDGKTLYGTGHYTGWQGLVSKEVVEATKAYWSTLTSGEVTTAGTWCRISDDYGTSWSEPIKSPVSTPHGTIQLANGNLMYVGRATVPGIGKDGIYAFISTDGGYNWNYQAKIHENSTLTFCEPHVVELSNGRLLVAIRVQALENVTIKDGDNTYTAAGSGFAKDTGKAVYSAWVEDLNDGKGGYICYTPNADNTAFERYTGKGVAAANRYGYLVYTCYSDDGGATWTTPEMITDKDGIPVYGTPPHLIQMDSGVVVMTLASREGADRGEYVIISYDGGMTWDKPICLSKWQSGTSDIGYPATVVAKDGSLISVYYQSYANKGDNYCSFLYTKWTLT